MQIFDDKQDFSEKMGEECSSALLNVFYYYFEKLEVFLFEKVFYFLFGIQGFLSYFFRLLFGYRDLNFNINCVRPWMGHFYQPPFIKYKLMYHI